MKRNHYIPKISENVLYQRFSKKTFLAKGLEKGIYQKMTISLRKTVWREIYAAQISTEISTQKIFEETFPPQTPWRESFTDLFSKKTLKHIEREIAAKKYVKTKFYPNMSAEKCATKQTLNRNLFQASSKRNRKIVWGNMPTQKSLKRNLYQKNIWRISPRKKNKHFFYQKLSRKILPRELWRYILCPKHTPLQ